MDAIIHRIKSLFTRNPDSIVACALRFLLVLGVNLLPDDEHGQDLPPETDPVSPRKGGKRIAGDYRFRREVNGKAHRYYRETHDMMLPEEFENRKRLPDELR
jgi:hypothetical protein